MRPQDFDIQRKFLVAVGFSLPCLAQAEARAHPSLHLTITEDVCYSIPISKALRREIASGSEKRAFVIVFAVGSIV